MHLNRLSSAISAFRKLYGQYKLQIVILAALGFLSGLMEGIGVGALVPLFSFITKETGYNSDLIYRVINKIFSYIHLDFSLQSLLILIVSLFILKAVFLFIFEYIRVKIISDYEKNIRVSLFRMSLKSNWSYLLKQKIGYLENVLMIDVDFSTRLLTNIANSILNFTSLLMYLAVALTISYSIAMTALLVGAVMLLLFKPLLYKRRLYARERTLLNKRIAHQVNENVAGFKILKAMGIEDKVERAMDRFFDYLRGLKIRSVVVLSFIQIALQPVSVIFISVVFALSYFQPNFGLAAFIAIIYLIQRIFIYIDRAQQNLSNMYDEIPYANNVVAFEQAIEKNIEADVGKRPFKFDKELVFRDVSFAYGESRPTLSEISFEVEKGKMIGIIGPSGSGKTTLVDLLLRLFRPQEGTILVDGVNAEEFSLHDWRRNIGYMSQDVFVKNDTIQNNIKFYDDDITEKDIIRATKMANIYDFIQTLPKKFSTVVGERGTMLSAGQRQRIVLARVLARNPQILVLDEATSALDSKSELLVQKAIEKLRGSVTIIIITHRPSTLMSTDSLIVLENGRINKRGSPEKVLKEIKSY